MSELFIRLKQNQIPVLENLEIEKSNRLSKLSELKSSQEKILAEIFFALAMGLSEMSRLYIAHLNIRPENIILDANYRPHFSDFDSCNQFAQPEHFHQDLKDLSASMEMAISQTALRGQIDVDQVDIGRAKWVSQISQSTQLLDLRAGILALARKGAAGEITVIEELINSLIHIYPELIEGEQQYFFPPAEPAEDLPLNPLLEPAGLPPELRQSRSAAH